MDLLIVLKENWNLSIKGNINAQNIINLIQEISKEKYVLAIKEQFRLRRFENIIINCNKN